MPEILYHGRPVTPAAARTLFVDIFACTWDPEEAACVFSNALRPEGEEERDCLLDAGLEVVLN